ncbi:MAG: inositol monophosphatase [Gammaproteobacteria bacterium]|nr:inositol monophosphatase [Gammaproteobacteria bacterium]
MLPSVEELASVVVAAAREALVPRFGRSGHTRKADGSVLTEADLAMQRSMREALAGRWPEFAFLGEEMDAAEQRRLLGTRGRALWCLDPLDGTSNFAAGLPFFSTSLALLIDGAIELGVVYDPARDECFTARRGAGAWLNGERLGRHRPERPLRGGIGLTDLKRLPPALAERLAREPPYASQRSFGSVALDWCWVAAGRVHVYLHGGQKLWDYVAGSLILAEAGGYAVTLDGRPVYDGGLEARSVAAALDGALFDEWIEWLGISPTREAVRR